MEEEDEEVDRSAGMSRATEERGLKERDFGFGRVIGLLVMEVGR